LFPLRFALCIYLFIYFSLYIESLKNFMTIIHFHTWNVGDRMVIVLMDCYCFCFSTMAMPKTLCYFPHQHIRLHRYLTNNKINTLKLLYFFLHYGTLLTTSSVILVLKCLVRETKLLGWMERKKANFFCKLLAKQ